MRISTIKILEQEGFFDFRRVQPRHWENLRFDFAQRSGKILPPLSALSHFGNLEELRILLSPLTITINFKNTNWIQFKFLPGFITDFASVPQIARWIIDNDELDLLAAALVHDANFSMHFLNFKQTNELFRKMIRARGRRFKSWLAWRAVSSRIGKRRYNAPKKEREYWTKKTVQYMGPDPEKGIQ